MLKINLKNKYNIKPGIICICRQKLYSISRTERVIITRNTPAFIYFTRYNNYKGNKKLFVFNVSSKLFNTYFIIDRNNKINEY